MGKDNIGTIKKEVVLDERSLSYNIQTASKLLQEWYLKKVGDVNA